MPAGGTNKIAIRRCALPRRSRRPRAARRDRQALITPPAQRGRNEVSPGYASGVCYREKQRWRAEAEKALSKGARQHAHGASPARRDTHQWGVDTSKVVTSEEAHVPPNASAEATVAPSLAERQSSRPPPPQQRRRTSTALACIVSPMAAAPHRSRREVVFHLRAVAGSAASQRAASRHDARAARPRAANGKQARKGHARRQSHAFVCAAMPRSFASRGRYRRQVYAQSRAVVMQAFPAAENQQRCA